MIRCLTLLVALVLFTTVQAEPLGKVGYAHLEGPIDRLRHRYLERVIEQARVEKLDTLIVHIDTDGGEVFFARDMFKSVLEQARDGPRMIAYVDFRAISAGAMIAYAHESIYVSPTASIGDIGVIFKKPDGEISYAPEKIETVVRTLLAQAAEQRGWNRGLLLKMTARNQTLYRIRTSDGTLHYVIEDDLPEFLSVHPKVDKDDSSQVIVYRGEDRLLTLTGPEALKLGMATGQARDLGELYRTLDVDPDAVTDLSPRGTERVAWSLARFGPILAGLALLFIMFELKTPGVGLWAGLGALLGGLFLMTHFALDLINNLELVLILIGAGLLFAELVTAVGGGLLGVFGALTLFGGLLLGFLPDELEFDVTDERFQGALGDAALNGIYTVGILALGILGFVWAASRSRPGVWSRHGLTLSEAITATSNSQRAERAEGLVGRTGTAHEALSPGGTVTIDAKAYTARALHGTYIEVDQSVEVVAVEFGELVVKRVGVPGGP